MRRVVAVDGPAGSGKSTVARLLAKRLGFVFLDTGALYRAAAVLAREAGAALDDGPAVAAALSGADLAFREVDGENRLFVGERDLEAAIRAPWASEASSRVAALPEVRAALLDAQRRFAEAGPLVAEGRDTGTTVFPDAALKVFLDAAPEERARRRAEQFAAAGRPVAVHQVLADILSRDARDAGRAASPLTRAADATILDTTGLTIDEVTDALERRWRQRMALSPRTAL